MKSREWKIITASLSTAVAVLVIVTIFLTSILNMGQISTLVNNSSLSLTPPSSVTKVVHVRYSGYMTVVYNSTAIIALTVKYTFAGHNFSDTYIGSSGRVNVAVLPSAVSLIFSSALLKADVHYSVYEQY